MFSTLKLSWTPANKGKREAWSEISNVQEWRQSNVKNSWLGQPQKICCWQMFASKVFHYQICIKTAALSALLQTEFEGECGSPKGWPLEERFCRLHLEMPVGYLCSGSVAQHCSWATILLTASLQQVMGKQPWSSILLIHHYIWTNTEFHLASALQE